jgi:hypothetical protein
MPSRTARRGLRDLPNVEQQHVNRVQFVQVIVQERAGAYFHLALGVKLPTKITEVRTVRECAYRVTELEQILVADCGQVWVAAMKYEPAQPPGETRRGAGRGVAELRGNDRYCIDMTARLPIELSDRRDWIARSGSTRRT